MIVRMECVCECVRERQTENEERAVVHMYGQVSRSQRKALQVVPQKPPIFDFFIYLEMKSFTGLELTK